MAFTFKLELTDGTPANPPTFEAAVPDWRAGDSIYLGRHRLRVVERRATDDGDGDCSFELIELWSDCGK